MPSLPSSFWGGGGGRGSDAGGILGLPFFLSLVLSTWGATYEEHTHLHSTLCTHTKTTGSTGLIPQELKQLKVEVSLWRYLLSLSSRRIPLLFLVLLAGRTTSVFQDPLPQEEDGEDGVWILGSVFCYIGDGASGRTAGGLLYNTKFCIGTKDFVLFCMVSRSSSVPWRCQY